METQLRASDYTSGNLNKKSESWLGEIRSIARTRSTLSLNPLNCALLVVDMNNYFAAPDGRCALPGALDIIPNIRKLLDVWRNQNGTVVFTRHGHEEIDDLGMLGKFFDDFIRADKPEADIIGDLTPEDGEQVIRKSTYDAFLNTDLEKYLRGKNITQVLITGVLTNMCCETTARSAFCRGFEVYLPVDATATTSEQTHLGSLKNMASCVGIPMSTQEIVDQCKR